MTGQEYIQRQINLVKQQIKGSRVKFTITDAVTKFQYDLYENELQTLESIEKELKALEVIKKKNVDVDYFLFWCKQGVGKVEDYNQLLKHKNGRCQRLQLTEKEFNLLKEVLE